MDNQSLPDESLFSPDKKIRILLAEYQAIEQMHAHYDVLNMSMTAIITAGVFTIWGMVIQIAFESNAPIDNPVYVNSVTVLALALFFVLSVWIRYLTIHRCIIIQKLDRSHEIESTLRMKQNSIFKYKAASLSEALTSDTAKRRPGGHTLELLLYYSLSTLGGVIALMFQWHVRASWTPRSLVLAGLLVIAPFLAIVWMSFCKLDAVSHIKGKVAVGLPWSVLFAPVMLINRFLRILANIGTREI